MAFVRLVVIGFAVLTVIYLCISWYSRSVRREKLENEWGEQNPGNTDMQARDAFVDAGLLHYESSLRKKLILLIFIIPPIVIAFVVYMTNAQ